MKTEAQLARTELELNAVDSALSDTKYYVGPRDHITYRMSEHSWKQYCRMLEDKLREAIYKSEYLEKNPRNP